MPTGSIFATWQPLRMSRRSWAAVTDFKARVFRLKPEVQILGYSKSIRHTKVEILRLKSCFLRKKETKLNANLWKAFSTELFCRRSWWFHVVLLNDLHLAHKPRPPSSPALPAMPFVNQERLVLKFPIIKPRPSAPAPFSMCVNDLFQFCAVAVHTIQDSFSCRLLTHKNGDFSAISVTQRICAAPISTVRRHISYRFCATPWCSI